MSFQPTSMNELQTIVREGKKLILTGAGTKTALSTAPDEAVALDMRGFNGIIEYAPSEYTFTAYAGTPLATIVDALAEHGQYLPFDPLLVQKGATLGGTVSANASGSGRWRYGGVRDFILGIRFVDGLGRFVRSGGKVVKNAAGFDLPKFFVGSLGQFGVLVEMSFKVFPQPKSFATLRLSYETIEEAMNAIFALMLSPLETDAIDIESQSDNVVMLIRLGGIEAAIPNRLARLKDILSKNSKVDSIETIENDGGLWQSINNLEWTNHLALVKVPISPRQVPAFDARLKSAKRRYTAAANVAWIALNDASDLSSILKDSALSGLQLLGQGTLPYLGRLKGWEILQRMKHVLDPKHVFLGSYDAAQD
jgi:glycolate oxidase FAD binding subunit